MPLLQSLQLARREYLLIDSSSMQLCLVCWAGGLARSGDYMFVTFLG